MLMPETDRSKTKNRTPPRNSRPVIEVDTLNLWYGDNHALKDVSFDLYPQEILAFIGPSGCGKTTMLKCLNRMHDGMRDLHTTGTIRVNGHEIHAPDIDPSEFRRRFGWVAQKPNPFPASVYENVAYGARIHGLVSTKADMDAHVEDCLRRADLWDEVKDQLFTLDGTDLSGGQQQRLCIARALGTKPDFLLMDEPTGSIDPIATQLVEDLMAHLRTEHTVVIVTHSMMQARRIADRVAYFHLGNLVEIGPTEKMFNDPKDDRVRDFISGKIG